MYIRNHFCAGNRTPSLRPHSYCQMVRCRPFRNSDDDNDDHKGRMTRKEVMTFKRSPPSGQRMSYRAALKFVGRWVRIDGRTAYIDSCRQVRGQNKTIVVKWMLDYPYILYSAETEIDDVEVLKKALIPNK
jgi:hypothetical protein